MKKTILIILLLLVGVGAGVLIGSKMKNRKKADRDNIRITEISKKNKIDEADETVMPEDIPPATVSETTESAIKDKQEIKEVEVAKEVKENKDVEVKTIIQETLFTGNSKMAILIDDSGASLTLAKDFEGLNMPLSFAVMPYLAKSREVNSYLSGRGYRVLLHLPMEGSDVAVNKNTKDLLTANLSKEDIINVFKKALENVGPVSGFNNHMGSVFTSSQEGMETVLEFAKSRRLFYVDSKTTAKSKAFKMARDMEIPSAECVHFLDNSKAVGDIEKELAKAVKISQKRGRALVIGHYHKNMVEALKNSKEMLEKSNVKLVFVDEILE